MITAEEIFELHEFMKNHLVLSDDDDGRHFNSVKFELSNMKFIFGGTCNPNSLISYIINYEGFLIIGYDVIQLSQSRERRLSLKEILVDFEFVELKHFK